MHKHRAVMVQRNVAIIVAWTLGSAGAAVGHIIPPEKLHPVAEAYRRCTFALNLNPVPWALVRTDAESIERSLRKVDQAAAERFDAAYEAALGRDGAPGNSAPEPPEARERKRRAVFELCP